MAYLMFIGRGKKKDFPAQPVCVKVARTLSHFVGLVTVWGYYAEQRRSFPTLYKTSKADLFLTTDFNLTRFIRVSIFNTERFGPNELRHH